MWRVAEIESVYDAAYRYRHDTITEKPRDGRGRNAIREIPDDITKDFSERKNLGSEYPDIVADVARIMKEEHEDRKK